MPAKARKTLVLEGTPDEVLNKGDREANPEPEEMPQVSQPKTKQKVLQEEENTTVNDLNVIYSQLDQKAADGCYITVERLAPFVHKGRKLSMNRIAKLLPPFDSLSDIENQISDEHGAGKYRFSLRDGNGTYKKRWICESLNTADPPECDFENPDVSIKNFSTANSKDNSEEVEQYQKKLDALEVTKKKLNILRKIGVVTAEIAKEEAKLEKEEKKLENDDVPQETSDLPQEPYSLESIADIEARIRSEIEQENAEKKKFDDLTKNIVDSVKSLIAESKSGNGDKSMVFLFEQLMRSQEANMKLVIETMKMNKPPDSNTLPAPVVSLIDASIQKMLNPPQSADPHSTFDKSIQMIAGLLELKRDFSLGNGQAAAEPSDLQTIISGATSVAQNYIDLRKAELEKAAGQQLTATQWTDVKKTIADSVTDTVKRLVGKPQPVQPVQTEATAPQTSPPAPASDGINTVMEYLYNEMQLMPTECTWINAAYAHLPPELIQEFESDLSDTGLKKLVDRLENKELKEKIEKAITGDIRKKMWLGSTLDAWRIWITKGKPLSSVEEVPPAEERK